MKIFIRKKIKTPLLPFDKYALKTIKNYMYNCKLSLLINEKNCTYEAVIQLLDEITNVQTETSIQKFFILIKKSYLFIGSYQNVYQKGK